MSGQGKEVPVPKFGSFKPKASADTQESNLISRTKSDIPSREGKGHYHRHRRRSRSTGRFHVRAVEPAVVLPVPKDDTTNLYIIDKQGDAKNLVYGSIHRYSVPPFHRIGADSVLGATRWLKIDRDVSDEKGIVLTERSTNTGARREKYVFARNEKKVSRLLRIRPEGTFDVSAFGDSDFILLQERSRKRKRTFSNSSDESDSGKDFYRSIEGEAKAKSKSIDDNLEYFTESDGSGSEFGRTIKFDEATRKQSIRLSRNVDENPRDIEAWIALIKHQDTLLGLSDDGRRNITSAEKRSTADIKLHLYEKALLKAGTTLATQERLLLGLMAEGAKLWDFKAQIERWEQISQDHLESVVLWKQYLDFRQSAFSVLRYEETKDIYLKRINLLKTSIQEARPAEIANREHTSVQGLFESLIYTTLRATLFMRESGYSEIAVAIWQAILEFNFLEPTKKLLVGSRMEIFKEFWESEVPRIGEGGATGWKNFDNSTDAPHGKIDEDTPPMYMMSANIFDGWLSAETFRSSLSLEPARTMDDVTEDDPYRVILWSDIEDFIIDLSIGPHLAGLKMLLVDAFLLFSRLPPCSELETSRRWREDSFLRGELLEWSSANLDATCKTSHVSEPPTKLLALPEIVLEDTKPVAKSNLFDQYPLQYFILSSDTIFPSAHWAKAFYPWKALYDGGYGPFPYYLLRNMLKSLVQVIPGGDFAEYYLAFEWNNEPGTVKKVAKGLLKQCPQSLRLYNAYAMIEWLRGNKDTAVNVITAALGMKSSLPDSEQQYKILLWKTWSWLLLDSGDAENSLKCLYSIVDEQTNLRQIEAISPALLLKTRQHLSSMRDYLISSGDIGFANIYTECLALEAYLSEKSSNETMSPSQGDIMSALTVFDNYSSELVSHGHKSSVHHELSHQSAARLLYHHIRSGPFRPALLRQRLSNSLTLFPKNTILLSFYAYNESRLRIDARVRTLLNTTVLTAVSDTITSRLFAICYEQRSGNIHSVRSAFENAVASPACASNPGLWRFYISFCATTKEFKKSAKEVFYRGIRACPWVKEIYLMAFRELRESMSFEELRAVYRVLGEKELRVHIDLEDRLYEWDEKHGNKRIRGS